MEKYLANYESCEIDIVEVERETASTVTLNGGRVRFKESKYEEYCDTRKEAVKKLKDNLLKNIRYHQRMMNDSLLKADTLEARERSIALENDNE